MQEALELPALYVLIAHGEQMYVSCDAISSYPLKQRDPVVGSPDNPDKQKQSDKESDPASDLLYGASGHAVHVLVCMFITIGPMKKL